MGSDDQRNDHTARAKTSDLAYFWSWAEVALGIAEQYPTPIELIYAFIAEHANGLDPEVDQQLVRQGVSGER